MSSDDLSLLYELCDNDFGCDSSYCCAEFSSSYTDYYGETTTLAYSACADPDAVSMANDLYEALGMDASASCMPRLKTIIIVVVVLILIIICVAVGVYCYCKKKRG